MYYAWTAIPDSAIPRTAHPIFQHLLDTYVSETNKVALTWKEFQDADLGYKPHARSTNVGDIFRHQLLSERRFSVSSLMRRSLRLTRFYPRR